MVGGLLSRGILIAVGWGIGGFEVGSSSEEKDEGEERKG